MTMSINEQLFDQAYEYIPGGVNTPLRAFKMVGGTPKFMSRAKDAYMWDEEDVEYIDYMGSSGSMIIGHANDDVLTAICSTVSRGLSFGTPIVSEGELAKKICEIIPSIEQVRLVSTGTEANMSAIRLARGYTARKKVIKFNGCYHGHVDCLLAKPGVGLQTGNSPASAGVPDEFIRDTVILEYNDVAELERVFEEDGYDIACVIVEPIAGNMGLVKPTAEFLTRIRELCTQFGTVLIFDEIKTGFRVGYRGAQHLLNITPDLTTLSKALGSGMPIGAFGGRKDIMSQLAPKGCVHQSGDLAGNPLSVIASLTTLEILAEEGIYDQLSEKTAKLVKGLKSLADEMGVPFNADYVGGMFSLYFSEKIPTNLEEVEEVDEEAFKIFFHEMLKGGIYLVPSPYECCFMSFKHTDEDITKTLEVAQLAFALVKQYQEQQAGE